MMLWHLIKKELYEVFTSPLIYILVSIFSFISGWLFFNYLLAAKSYTHLAIMTSVLIPIFGNINFLLLIFIPMMTMRSFAEERKLGTLDLLIHSALTNRDIVLGKFCALFIQTLFLLLPTFLFPLILSTIGFSEWGIVISAYTGLILSISCYIFVGMFASAITDNQLVAAFISFSILVSFLLVAVSTNATDNYILGKIGENFSIGIHFEWMARGVVRTIDLIYFLSFASFFFLLTKKVLESKRW